MTVRTLRNRVRMLVLLSVISIPSLAQPTEINFERLTINDGLSLSSVYSIHQDEKGFLWFGTEDGLNKYDGAKFTIYNHYHGNSNSLSHKWIEYLAEDKNGTIWTGSKHGVTAIDPATEDMHQFFHIPDSISSLSNDTVTAMAMQSDALWIGTNSGLNRIEMDAHRKNVRVATDTALLCKRINTLFQDNRDRIWIGTCGGLFMASSKDKKAQNIVRNLPDGSPMMVRSILLEGDTLWVGHQSGIIKYILEDSQEIAFKYPGIAYGTDAPVQSMMRDSRGALWIVTDRWLSRYNKGKIIDLILAPVPTPSLATNPLKPLIEDQEGYIWFGTFGSGIYRINTGNGRITHLTHHPGFNNSLSDNTINSIFQDRSGTVWIGTFGAGISVYKPGANIIETLQHIAYSDRSMSSSFVWSIMEDRKGNVWIGTNNTGVDVYNPVSFSFTNYQNDPENSSSVPPFGVRKIFQARDGSIWIGSDGGGLCKHMPGRNSFRKFLHDPDDSTTISNNSVRAIYEDSTGIFWIGTRRGLNRFDPKKEKFIRYLHDPQDETSLSHDFIYSAIHMDQRGNLWIGTYGGGLNMMDTKTGTFTSYQYDPDNETSISDDIVFSIYEDAKGYMWIGTNSGLNLFNPGNGKFKRYGIEAGLPNEVIYGIMPDQFNRLWMTTNKGMSMLDLTKFNFKNYTVRDGLQSNEFNGGAYHAGASGKLYAGGVYGLNIIDPEEMKPQRNTAELIITQLEILGKKVYIAPSGIPVEKRKFTGEVIQYNENYYLEKDIAYLDQIRLKYNERSFSIEFIAMNHPSPEKLSYRYRMTNLEDEWNNVGRRNYVTYGNMRPGNYLLEVDAVNGDGFSAMKKASLNIIIVPPFWYSPWFIALEILFIVVLSIVIYRILLNQRTNRILKEQYAQIKIAHEKLQESEKGLKESNATKDKFFSIISHDLKNPFASVLSISELLNENFEAAEKLELKHGVSKIHQTNKYIYQLLENLLTWSKSQRGKLSIDTTRFNLAKVIETNVNVLRLDAERKKIQIHCDMPDEIVAYADREMISTVFRNLLNNAIKFTFPEKSITISGKTCENSIEISIADEGIGIKKEHLDKLFSIEDKFKSEGTSGEKGTGLGLIICKEFIEKNNGRLAVESEPGKGSTFRFTVPLAPVEATLGR
jgi:ligand-binding sensor domain-containing protein/signal transduction histidine kinase